MYRSVYAVQADDCALRALKVSSEIDREILLATEKALRDLADADERIQKVRERNLAAGQTTPVAAITLPASETKDEKAA